MVVQHPVTMEYEDSAIQIRETLDSVRSWVIKPLLCILILMLVDV